MRLISAVTSVPSTVDHRPRRGGVAVEDVARAAAVDDDLPAEVADLGDVRVAHADDAGIGAATRSRMTFASRRLVEAARLGAGRGVDDEDERVVGGPDPALGGQPAQPVELLVAELVVGPLGGRRDRLRHAVLVLRERGPVVEVADGDVGVARDDRARRRASSSRSASTAPLGSGPFMTRSPGDEHRVGLRADLREHGLERDPVAVDVGEDGDPRHHAGPRPAG